jgi:hypothetical protein
MMAGGHSAIFDGSIPSGNFVRLDEMADVTERLLTLLGR